MTTSPADSSTIDGPFGYRLLTPTDRSALRLERAHALEADLYRLELQLEEAADAAERELLAGRADRVLRRLRVHLTALAGAIPDPAEQGPSRAGPAGDTNGRRAACSPEPS